MIDKIKNKIKQIENRFSASHQLQEDQLALLQLLNLFGNQTFLPLTSWSISPREVLHICNDIVINKRKSIVEFGSGFSTLCIAQLLKIKNIEANFISVENNEAWAADMNQIIAGFGLQEYVSIVYAPIADVPTEFALKSQTKWYDTSSLSSLLNSGSIDLIIVDGPYGNTTPFARYSAIPFLKNVMAANFAIFLDDSSRNDEKQIAASWQKQLNGQISDHKRYVCITAETGFDVAPYTVKPKV